MRPGRRSLRSKEPETTESESPAIESSAIQKKINKEKKKKKRKQSKNKENRQSKSKRHDVEKVFDRQREDGSTSLAILTPGEGIVPGTDKDKPVSLGSLVGRVRYGTANLAGFREDRRNTAKPMYPIYYGGYSSHGPTYDSTFANMTAEESVLVGPYFDFRRQENERLIRDVCREDDYTDTFVDHLMDLFSGREVENVADKNTEKDTKTVEDDIDFEYIRSLENEGIDMSFISSLQVDYEFKKDGEETGDFSLERQLEMAAKLISDLANAQSSRLSKPPPACLSNLPGPEEKEVRLADQVVSHLTSLTGRVAPGQVVEQRQLRKAMGIHAPLSPNKEVPVLNGVIVNGVSGESDTEMIAT